MADKYDYEMELDDLLQMLSDLMEDIGGDPLDTENYVWNGVTLKFKHKEVQNVGR